MAEAHSKNHTLNVLADHPQYRHLFQSGHKAAQSPKEKRPPSAPVRLPVHYRKLTDNAILASTGPVICRVGDQFTVFDRQSSDSHTARSLGCFPNAQDAKAFVALL
jgi:hypothetical protein